jgi:hypothetical protein
MKNNKKKITFKEGSKVAKYIVDLPKPATNHVPKWYKDDKLFTDGNNDFIKSKRNFAEGTYKLCVPLVDALTSGYILVTPCEILVTNLSNDGYEPFLEWKVDWTPLDMQNNQVLGSFPIPVGHNKTLFRWVCDWQIKTPNGYSLWTTHPVNRYDLPFTSLTGFIDTDKHPNRLLFPFFIKDGFEGIIPEGTPFAQIIPIKRDRWHSERLKFDEDSLFFNNNIMNLNFARTYKNKFWSKKEYR